jgi:DNA polymerase-3 subunit delta'
LKTDKSHILISSSHDTLIDEIKKEHNGRVVLFQNDDFKIEDAKAVINEAYIAESEIKYIIISTKNINIPAQNSLLKILEEPPKNILFIIIIDSKSSLLPTIRSRLSIFNIDKSSTYNKLDINLKKLSLNEMFLFIKEHERDTKSEAKDLIQSLLHHALHVEKLTLSEKQGDSFSNAIKLIELNTKPSVVLTHVLMGFLK